MHERLAGTEFRHKSSQPAALALQNHLRAFEENVRYNYAVVRMVKFLVILLLDCHLCASLALSRPLLCLIQVSRGSHAR